MRGLLYPLQARNTKHSPVHSLLLWLAALNRACPSCIGCSSSSTGSSSSSSLHSAEGNPIRVLAHPATRRPSPDRLPNSLIWSSSLHILTNAFKVLGSSFYANTHLIFSFRQFRKPPQSAFSAHAASSAGSRNLRRDRPHSCVPASG